MAWGGYGWRPYVSVGQRRAQAKREMAALRKKGMDIQPVEIEGRKIAKTFWGKAWCDHLESFSDYENRLPRGRTYVRNGSVCHLAIEKGEVRAKVAGQEVYDILIRISLLSKKKWKGVKRSCSGHIGSLLELLQGKLSVQVMQVVTDRKNGLFPLPGEISLGCDCPDWATMCKHVAAVLYGVGARLDEQPELLFKLRGVDHEELIAADAEAAVIAATSRGSSKRLVGDDLSDVFGIDLDAPDDEPPAGSPRKKQAGRKTAKAARKKAGKKVVAKKTPKKKPVKKKASAKQVVKKKAAKKSPKKKAGKKKTGPKRAVKKKAIRKTSKKKAVAKTAKRAPKNTPRKAD